MKKRNIYIRLAVKGFIVIFILSMVVFLTLPDREGSRNKAKISLTSNEFIEEMNNGNGTGLDQYIEQAIEIEGIIDKIVYRNDTHTIILYGGDNSKFVLCEMHKEEKPKIEKYHKGEKVKIKGIYKGSLMDAIFLNCVILEKNVNK